MFGNSGNAAKAGGIQKAVSALGGAIGLGVAVMAAPLIYAETKIPLFSYFMRRVGDHDISLLLMWIMNAIMSFIVFASTSMLLSFVLIWAIATVAAKSLE